MAQAKESKRQGPDAPVKPILVSQDTARVMAGDGSRAGFAKNVLPKVETVCLGRRRMVVLSSLESVLAEMTQPPRAAAEWPNAAASVSTKNPKAPRAAPAKQATPAPKSRKIADDDAAGASA